MRWPKELARSIFSVHIFYYRFLQNLQITFYRYNLKIYPSSPFFCTYTYLRFNISCHILKMVRMKLHANRLPMSASNVTGQLFCHSGQYSRTDHPYHTSATTFFPFLSFPFSHIPSSRNPNIKPSMPNTRQRFANNSSRTAHSQLIAFMNRDIIRSGSLQLYHTRINNSMQYRLILDYAYEAAHLLFMHLTQTANSETKQLLPCCISNFANAVVVADMRNHHFVYQFAWTVFYNSIIKRTALMPFVLRTIIFLNRKWGSDNC